MSVSKKSDGRFLAADLTFVVLILFGTLAGLWGWPTYPFLLLGVLGHEITRAIYAFRLKRILPLIRSVSPDQFYLELPAECDDQGTLIPAVFLEAGKKARFYLPGLALFSFFYVGLGWHSQNFAWALTPLSLLLLGATFDRLAAKGLQCLYCRAWLENPQAPFAAVVKPPQWTQGQGALEALARILGVAGPLMAVGGAVAGLRWLDVLVGGLALWMQVKALPFLSLARLEYGALVLRLQELFPELQGENRP